MKNNRTSSGPSDRRAYNILKREKESGGSVRRMMAARTIQREAAMCMQRMDEVLAVAVTVSRVEVSPDLECANVFILYNVQIRTEEQKKSTLKLLDSISPALQSTIIKKLGLRKMRKINFRIDSSQDKAQYICDIIDKISSNS